MKWILKTSTVRVATKEHEGVYQSLDEMPAELRRKLRASLDAATVSARRSSTSRSVTPLRFASAGSSGRTNCNMLVRTCCVLRAASAARRA